MPHCKLNTWKDFLRSFKTIWQELAPWRDFWREISALESVCFKFLGPLGSEILQMFQNHWRIYDFFTPSSTINRGQPHRRGDHAFKSDHCGFGCSRVHLVYLSLIFGHCLTNNIRCKTLSLGSVIVN